MRGSPDPALGATGRSPLPRPRKRHRIDRETASPNRCHVIAPRLPIVIAIKSAAQRIGDVCRDDLERISLRQIRLGRRHERDRRRHRARSGQGRGQLDGLVGRDDLLLDFLRRHARKLKGRKIASADTDKTRCGLQWMTAAGGMTASRALTPSDVNLVLPTRVTQTISLPESEDPEESPIRGLTIT